MKKLNRKSGRPSFKKTCVYTIFPPPFLIFQIHPHPLRPHPGEVIKIYSPPPFKKGGEWIWTMIDNYNYWNSLSKCIKMKIFLLFTIIYSKINMNVVKAIICQHILEKIQISLGKSLSSCWVLRQILKAV